VPPAGSIRGEQGHAGQARKGPKQGAGGRLQHRQVLRRPDGGIREERCCWSHAAGRLEGGMQPPPCCGTGRCRGRQWGHPRGVRLLGPCLPDVGGLLECGSGGRPPDRREASTSIRTSRNGDVEFIEEDVEQCLPAALR